MNDALDRSPWYVRTWGWILLLWGLLNLFGLVMSLAPWSDAQLMVTELVGPLVVVAGGIGLLTESRWGWFLGLIVGILGVSAGSWVILDVFVNGGDITFIGAEVFALLFFVIPGVLLLLSLLTPRARAWLDRLSR